MALLRCAEIFNDNFITNLLLNVMAKIGLHVIKLQARL